jgi:hypothetical protein
MATPIMATPIEFHKKWYYAFCDVVSDTMGEIIVVSDDLVTLNDSCMGIFMFTGYGLFSNLEEARNELGCGPLASIATKDDVRSIKSQFNVTFDKW